MRISSDASIKLMNTVPTFAPATLRIIHLLSIGLLCWSLGGGRAQAEDWEDLGELKAFNELSGNAYVEANQKEAQEHFEVFKSAKGEARKREARIVRFYAWRGGQMDLFDEAIADGHLAETEIKVPAESVKESVEVIHEVPPFESQYNSRMPVCRRITPSAFEIWTPTEGWLFNRKGELLHTAKPPRDQSEGRQWFGAFLPDGRWITTELHADDGRVYIFNRKGRCTHEIKASVLIPSEPSDYSVNLIPWARSNRDGDAWVVRVGSEEGRGEVLLEPDGTWKRIQPPSSPWQQCLTRELGVRLAAGISFYKVESDDGKLEMHSGQPSHGMYVGRPIYDINPTGPLKDDDSIRKNMGGIPSEGNEFGFWPRSHAVYVFNGERTWFFDAAQRYRGWIAGERVGDAPDHKAMIFRLKDGRCATVSPSLKVLQVQHFALSDGSLTMPLELHPDIGLGVFSVPAPSKENPVDKKLTDIRTLVSASKKVVLAHWEKKSK
jgi:hypothetical protein